MNNQTSSAAVSAAEPSVGKEFERGFTTCGRCGCRRPESVLDTNGDCVDWQLCQTESVGNCISSSEYEDFCLSVWKRFDDPRRELLVIGLGVAGEAGEFADLVKKAETYDKPIDLAKAVKELGDIEYYLAIARRRLNITRDTVLRANIKKLSARHPAGFNKDAEAVKAVEGQS